MSESRQRLTGSIVFGIVLIGLLWVIFATLPLFTRYLQITAMDPRWLTPEDLTWQRVLFNALSKPGIRFMLVSLVGVMVGMLGWVKMNSVQGPRRIKELEFKWVSCSGEWVIDGARKNSLSEYGKFVGVI